MILEQINKEKLLIVFSHEDIKKFDTIYGQSIYIKGNMVKVIREVLFLARVKTGFNSQNRRLTIELIERNKSCYVMATILQEQQTKTPQTYRIKQSARKCVFSFSILEDLLCVVERVYSIGVNVVNSQIVRRENKYFMILQARNAELLRLAPILSEYGKLVGEGNTDTARYFESGKVIIKDRAIQVLGRELTDSPEDACLSR
ncbi:MAG: adaptor protein MecA [Oscillospiraceae bacterium]|nr:adaptor protein MecA [Oscillospiraceae bacterium]